MDLFYRNYCSLMLHLVILRVLNSMVMCFGYKSSPNMIGIQDEYSKNFHTSALNDMRSLMIDDCFETWRW